MHFQISDGVLIKYNGLDSHVVVPDGVTEIGREAFCDCSNLASIALPDSLTKIGYRAFCGCKSLSGITLPVGLTVIGDSAFYGCKSLTDITLPEGVRWIGGNAFEDCQNLRRITLPEGLIRIRDGAFSGCCKLSKVTLPEGLKEIGNWAFSRCRSQSSITLPESVTEIGDRAFECCKKINFNKFTAGGLPSIGKSSFKEGILIHVEASVLKTDKKISAYWGRFLEKTDDEACAYLLVYQTGKGWMDYIYRTAECPSNVLCKAIDLMRQSGGKFKSAYIKQLHETAIYWRAKLDNASVEKIIAFMEEASPKSAKELKEKIAYERIPEEVNPIEAYVQEISEAYVVNSIISSTIKSGILYADRKGTSSIEAVKICLSEYAKLYVKHSAFVRGEMSSVKMLQDGHRIKQNSIADKIAEALNREELINLLEKGIHGNNYRSFILAYARWAGEANIKELSAEVRRKAKGKAKERYWSENMHEALFLSDTRAAMEHFDKCNDLQRYAEMKGMTAQELRDTLMMPDFGFDEDGVKRYDIGGNIIRISVTPRLELKIFDSLKNKEVRSIPKKSDDPEKALACAEDFAEFKKEFRKFIQDKTALLRKLHITGDTIRSNIWQEVYCKHPVLQHITPLLVWQDAIGKSFMRISGKTVGCHMQEYTPSGDIRVAHVMNMDAEDVSAWQDVLVQNGISQIFDQMWEPVIHWKKAEIPNRYKGVKLSKQERSALKKALEQRGVTVKAGEMDRMWNHRSETYEFSNSNTLYFGNSLQVKYTVNPKSEVTTFGKAQILNNGSPLEMNASIFEFDCAVIQSHIKADQDDALRPEALAQFTVAQITKFVNLAIDSKAGKCTALLMNYKNEHFPTFADVNEFTLDW